MTAFLESVALSVIPLFTLSNSGPFGSINSFLEAGMTCFTAVVMVVNFKVFDCSIPSIYSFCIPSIVLFFRLFYSFYCSIDLFLLYSMRIVLFLLLSYCSIIVLILLLYSFYFHFLLLFYSFHCLFLLLYCVLKMFFIQSRWYWFSYSLMGGSLAFYVASLVLLTSFSAFDSNFYHVGYIIIIIIISYLIILYTLLMYNDDSY